MARIIEWMKKFFTTPSKPVLKSESPKSTVQPHDLLEALGRCLREHDYVIETFVLLDNANYLNDDILGVLKDRKINLHEDSHAIARTRQTLRAVAKVGEKDRIICEKCDAQVDLYGDEKLEAIGQTVWFYEGCPYCGNKMLKLIPG